MSEEQTTATAEAPSESNEVAAKLIPLSLIVEPGFRLREPQRDTDSYQELFQSIKRIGVKQAIVVRPIKRDGVDKYELIDGTQRFNASMDAGKTHIPCLVEEMDDQRAREIQITNNIVRVEQRPAEVGSMLKDMLNNDASLTLPEIARRISKSPSYVQDRLSLNKLTPDIQELVNSQKIPLVNAVMLSRFDEEHQKELLDDAMNQPADKFLPEARERKKQIDKAKREARAESPPEFTPIPKLRKKDVLLAERDCIAENKSSLILGYLKFQKIENTDQVRGLVGHVLDWVTQLDEKSLAAAKGQWEEKQKLKAEKAKALEEERAKKKAAKEKEKATL